MDPFRAPASPRRSKTKDRFITPRSGANLEQAFSIANSTKGPFGHLDAAFSPIDTKQEESKLAKEKYATVLKSELFGDSPSSSASNISLTSFDSPERPSPIRHSASVLSLPTSPRRKREIVHSNSGILKSTAPRLFRSETDLSDISLGGGSAVNGGGGVGSSLRPESKDFLLKSPIKPRNIPSTPSKILDAPTLVDDFYVNLLEWSPGISGRLAVGLRGHAYLWDSETGDVADICALEEGDDVTSISWIGNGEHLVVGTKSGFVQIYDVETGQRLRNMAGHLDRVGTLSSNNHILSSGSRDQQLIHRDVRVKAPYIEKFTAHHGEICGLKWSTELQQLATGGNDNKLKIYSGLVNEPVYVFDDHSSAVKAIDWSPHQRGLLASGGGYCDRTIKFWNTLNGNLLNSIDANSQVCNMTWSPHFKELITTQGNRFHDIVVWKYPTMKPITTLRGHACRVLHMSISPDGRTLATGSGDQTLRLWKMFDVDNGNKDDSIVETFPQLR
ncbi:Cdh1 protein [Starmerella bacillaris]|uniref:Cdh1 protein n=1 Tax=Starmerella bacillaris TaxID=1247836 RepID=A0AAV5RNV2_STABA|nr:Cdh1 protein [Starmerella bacillaris]